MRVGVGISDRSLATALRTLLEQHGHDVVPLAADPDLVILHDSTTSAPSDAVATLYLRPTAHRRPDADPRTALSAALQSRGVAVWGSPFDPRALIDVLGSDVPVAEPAPAAPRLDAAPHAWFMTDPDQGAVIASSRLASDQLEEEGVPRDLLQRLVGDSEGVVQVEFGGVPQVAIWWTGTDGNRVVCLMPDLRLVDARADRNVRSLAEIGRMAATLAHEIRNPVASVAGALDLLEDIEDPDERVEVVGMARERLSQMRTLLDDTLRLARPIEGACEPIEAQALVRSCLSALSTDPDFARMTVRVEAPVEPLVVLAHLEPMQQALTNLLLNAAQAQPGAGTITIDIRGGPRNVGIRVRDEGPGIPEDLRNEVFRPFYTTKTEGTGLGLAFVHRVVDSAGGTAAVEDSPSGTCILVSLPRER